MFNSLEPLIISNNYQPSSYGPMTPFESNNNRSFSNHFNDNEKLSEREIQKEEQEEQEEDVEEEKSRFRSFCFPDNFSTSSGPSVNSYLRKIYGDSVSAASNNNNGRLNSNNSYGYNRQSSNNPYNVEYEETISSTTMDPEERRVLVSHLNEYSFETLKEGNESLNPIGKSNNIIETDNNDKRDLEKDICPRTPSPVVIKQNTEIENTHLSPSVNFPKTNYSNNQVPMRRGSMIPTTPNIYSGRRFSHRKSNAISLTKAFGGLKIDNDNNEGRKDEIILDDSKTTEEKSLGSHGKSLTPFERFKDIYMDDDDSPISPLSYPHHTSPIKTINNTNEQIQRNKNGKFGSLNEFADFNNINIEGKAFCNRPSTPKINLETNFLAL